MQDPNMPGGFNPMMLMLLNKEDKENKDDDMMKAILMSQMFTGQGMNPLMMMAMINNNNESDMINTILLLQMCSGQGFMHGTPINNYSSQGANTLTMFSKEMFDLAQEIRTKKAKQNTSGANAKRDYYFSGMCECQECGSGM